MNIKKLHWRYAHEAYAINAFIGDQWLHLRVCAHGYNENDDILHTLYCTADGRFFHKRKDGWRELLPTHHSGRRTKCKAAGGGYDSPTMGRFNHLLCHKLVCTAFHGLRPDGYECDHLNGNHLDWTADNLQWVTPQENRRRATIMRRLRKMGIDPKVVYTRNLKGIYSLEEAPLEYFLDRLPEVFAGDSSQLTIENINLAVATALDETDDNTLHCSRCGCAMIEDTEERRLSDGRVLCDCCYDDLYG